MKKPLLKRTCKSFWTNAGIISRQVNAGGIVCAKSIVAFIIGNFTGVTLKTYNKHD